MRREAKITQLQLRVTPTEKRRIRQCAKRAGMGISEWILSRLQTDTARQLQQLVDRVSLAAMPSYVLAELNDLLSRMQRLELERALRDPLRLPASPQMQNQIAAMLEVAAHRSGATVPAWVAAVPPLAVPQFATALVGLRLHLLTHAPPPFRRRNLFVDASIGDRV